MKVWNNLCDEIAIDKGNKMKEDAFQKRISLFFQSALFWSSFTDDLREQYKIGFAHTKGFADIVLMKNGCPEIIIELKKPNNVQDADNIKQLTDYMKITRCLFGIYLGEKIDLFYDDYKVNREDPILATSIAFEKDNELGEKLLSLLKNNTYSSEKLADFCQSQIKIRSVLNHWLSQQGIDEIYNFILKKSYLADEEMDNLKMLLKVNVTSASSQKEKPKNNSSSANIAKAHDSTLYSLDNEKFMSKRAFAFSVIKKVVDDFPQTTVKDIQKLLNSKVFVTKKVDWEKMSIDARGRYCDKEDELLTDGEGTEFLVSDQWTKDRVEMKILAICKHFQWKVYRK